MKKIFVNLFIVCLLFSFTSALSGLDNRDYRNDTERRYKSRYSSRDYGRYRDRKVRRVYRYSYKIPRGIYWKDLKRIRRYQRKIEKLRWRMSYRPMSHYRYMRYARKISYYQYKIRRIIARYRYYRR